MTKFDPVGSQRLRNWEMNKIYRFNVLSLIMNIQVNRHVDILQKVQCTNFVNVQGGFHSLPPCGGMAGMAKCCFFYVQISHLLLSASIKTLPWQYIKPPNKGTAIPGVFAWAQCGPVFIWEETVRNFREKTLWWGIKWPAAFLLYQAPNDDIPLKFAHYGLICFSVLQLFCRSVGTWDSVEIN